MAVDAEELVTRIFREVVDRGNEAVTQAEDVADEDEEVGWRMLKAGQALVKEGERAIKRLRPLLENRPPEFCDAVKRMMIQNEEIMDKQRSLDSMLYDFDDYMEVDSFEGERFTELQSATKAFALTVMESIRKLMAQPIVVKAEPEPEPEIKEESVVTVSALPPPAPRPSAFPPLPPLPPGAVVARPESRSSRHASTQPPVRPSTQGRERPGMSLWPKPPPQNLKLGRTRSGSAGGHSGLPSPTAAHMQMQMQMQQEYRPTTALRPPPSPQPLQRPADEDASRFDFGLPTRSAPKLAKRPSHSDLASPRQEQAERQSPERPMRNHEMERMSRLADTLRMPTDARYNLNSPGLPTQTSFLDQEPYPDPPSTTYNDRRLTGTTASDRQSSNFDATSPLHSNSNRTSAFSNATSYTSPTRHSNNNYGGYGSGYGNGYGNGNNNGIPRSSSLHTPTLPMELREKSVSSISERENKLMLVEEWASTHTSTTHDTSMTGYPSWRPVDCKLGIDSSFIAMKGFCKGALLFKDSGPGEGVKKVGGAGSAQAAQDFSAGMGFAGAYSSNAHFQETMAQCTRCEYTHKYSQLMQDLDKDSLAALQAHGLRYRKRFLYKAHLPTKIMTKAYYACPFCAQTGATPREGDATVFGSAAQLLRHIARHPQPLPEVPGLTVLYGAAASDDAAAANDFDLHLPSPPAAAGGPPESDAAKVAMLPAVMAAKDHIQLPGEKPLERPEKTTTTPVLQFFAGARIVGAEFPEQWGGKWCTGWHDGDFGAFPIKVVTIEAPRRGKMANQGAPVSRRTCVTKWKFDVRSGAGTGWLAFDRGETITNLEWDDPEAWYWVGTNKKGKWGIIPSSHIKMDSVKDGSVNDSSSSITKQKKSILPW